MINLKNITCNKKIDLTSNSELLILGIFENKKLSSEQKRVDQKLNKNISKILSLENFKGKKNTKVICYGNDKIKRVLILGLGDKKNYSSDFSRSIASQIVQDNFATNHTNISIDGNSFGLKDNYYAQSFSEGLVLGSYNFIEYKTQNKNKNKIKSVEIRGDINIQNLQKGYCIGMSVGFARDLGNHPANILTPTYLSKEAKKIANQSSNMKCTIIDIKDFKKMKFGAFLGVAQGAKEPAKMIIVEYKGGKKNEKPIALVGKGLTFDTGGISIKPSPSMDEMKFDMCGSATVLGVLKAVSNLKPQANIVFAIGATENMPGSNAQRPGDIVKAYNGKTIEVLNTDAEGRLVLADVLSYINDQYSPTSIIDFATLTGAVLIALGDTASGVMGNNEKLMNEIKEASKITGEKVWELPLWPEYTKQIEGKYADIKNLGEGRLAGTITAGAFLKEFVGDTPWVHMDIAGTAWGPKKPSYQPKVGATGVAVRLIYQLIENRL